MNNLFDYATKELSQDAFLAWLISSSKQKEKDFDLDSYNASRRFLSRVAHIDKKEKITDIVIKQQLEKIDVVAYIATEKEKIGLFIEDKVYYIEHDNQLNKYNNEIKKIKKKEKLDRVVKCYFKPFRLDKEEMKRVKEAEWEDFSNSIRQDVRWFFSYYKDSNNLILKQYAKHINSLYYNSYNKNLPTKSKDHPLCWRGFFQRSVIPVLEKDFDCTVSNTYSYAILSITPKSISNKYIPTLILRSDECNNKCITAKISVARIKYKNKVAYNKSLSFLNQNLFKTIEIKSNKQMINAESKHHYENQGDFIELVKKIAYGYKKLFSQNNKKK